MKEIQIVEKKIGKSSPVYVIAEIGINHNGDAGLARETIDAALDSGADAVKLQTFKAESFVHPDNPGYTLTKSCELSYEETRFLFEYTRKRNGIIFSTPESIEDIIFLSTLNPSAIKIASMDLNYKEFVKVAAQVGKPIILSTGMSYLHEVTQSVRWIEEEGNSDIILLHCISCYPTPPDECNLAVINTLANAFGYPVGFSDHTIGIEIPYAAACMGATVIEKHFTLDKKLKGPDHAGSADPSDLSRLVKWLRDIEKARGSGIKIPSKSEENKRLNKRRSIYAKNTLHKGDTLEISDVQFLTPSVPESQLEDLPAFLGRILRKEIPKYGLITSTDLL